MSEPERIVKPEEDTPENNKCDRSRLKQFVTAPFFSPKGLLFRAAGLALLFGICLVVGLREHTTFLSGTGTQESAVWGLTYILAYLGFVLLAPTFLLAAALLALWQKWVQR